MKVVWVEAIREVYKKLIANTNKYPGTVCINACVSDKDGDIVDFNISNNEMQSSSMLEFGTHKTEHPSVIFTHKTRLQTMTVKSILKEKQVDPQEYDFINLDIQGAELMALKGMDLAHVRYVYIEVNEKELYKGCPLLPEIDQFLNDHGFERVETKMTSHGWGDAFYIRKTKLNIVSVPEEFKLKHPFAYPTDNDIDFEKWYADNFYLTTGRVYLPIMWTAYYCKKKPRHALQLYLNSLDKSLKYFTIVQYDDGILNDLAGLDIKVFSMSGQGDYYLPLLCKDHAAKIDHTKTIFASFLGRVTHPVRSELLKLKEPRWMVTDTIQPLGSFCNILARSIFTLCPRGYGPTSFRIKEAMQYGSIPVYISDYFIEPHGIDFNTYGVKVSTDQVKDLPRILNGINVKEKQEAVKAMWPLYTYKGNFDIINKIIQDEREEK